MVKKQPNTLCVLIMVLVLFVFQQFASRTGGFIANLFTYNHIDNDDVFVWISVHHIVQMLVALLAIWVIIKALKLDFMFRRGNIRTGLKYFAIFSAIVLILTILVNLLASTCTAFDYPLTFDYPLNCKNIIGTLCFQLFLSGPSEEILFRALPIILLVYIIGTSKIIKIRKLNIPIEIIIAAFLFFVAHLDLSFRNNNWFQLVIVFIYGICWGIAYQKSNSIIYPMAMHSMSNVIAVGIGYIFTTF